MLPARRAVNPCHTGVLYLGRSGDYLGRLNSEISIASLSPYFAGFHGCELTLGILWFRVIIIPFWLACDRQVEMRGFVVLWEAGTDHADYDSSPIALLHISSWSKRKCRRLYSLSHWMVVNISFRCISWEGTHHIDHIQGLA